MKAIRVAKPDCWSNSAVAGTPTTLPVSTAEAYQRGCAADDAGACERLASLYYRGRGVTRDDAVAARLFSVACDGGRAEACAELGFMHERGLGVSSDATWSGHYRARACELGYTPACEKAGAGNPAKPTSVPAK